MRDRNIRTFRANRNHHYDYDNRYWDYHRIFPPGSTFVVKESSGPVSYRYGEKVNYVTRRGKTLTDDEVRTRVKVGIPVNVHFITEGKDRIINRVEIDDD
jgi:hypothetical protein